MAFLYPPKVGSVSVVHVAGAASGNIIAAPGVGFALRIVCMHVAISRATTGLVDDLVVDATPGTALLRASGLQLTGTSYVAFTIPEPGYLCAANSLLRGDTSSSIASGTSNFVVYYYVDAVN